MGQSRTKIHSHFFLIPPYSPKKLNSFTYFEKIRLIMLSYIVKISNCPYLYYIHCYVNKKNIKKQALPSDPDMKSVTLTLTVPNEWPLTLVVPNEWPITLVVPNEWPLTLTVHIFITFTAMSIKKTLKKQALPSDPDMKSVNPYSDCPK